MYVLCIAVAIHLRRGDLVGSKDPRDAKRFIKDGYYQEIIRSLLLHLPHSDIHVFSQV
jgi:hypothetical protein